MKITKISQPTGPPPNKPLIRNPVCVRLDVPVYYAMEHGLAPSTRGIVCGSAFAVTVLKALNEVMQRYHFALVHVGVYAPRQARHKDGTPILPLRWSNHAHGEAMDFKGIVTEDGQGDFLNIAQMKAGCPAKLNEIVTQSRAAIMQIGRRPEIEDEHGWYHLGIWPE